MTFVAHSKKLIFVPFYFIHCEMLEGPVDTNCCLRESLVINVLKMSFNVFFCFLSFES